MRRRFSWLLGSTAIVALLSGVFGLETASGPIRLLKDINDVPTQETSSFPFGFARLGGITLFAATSPDVGWALWKTDGTAAGTSRVKDVDSTSLYGSIESLTTLGGFVYFVGDDGVHGGELWRTDGTEDGTVLVKDIRPGPLGSFSGTSLTVFHGNLYFKADDGLHGLELWRSDGTDAGTVLVKDAFPDHAFPGNLNGAEVQMRVVGDLLLFTGVDLRGLELWRSDGTEAGTVLVKDIDPGSRSGLWHGLGDAAVIDGTLYFVGFELTNGNAIWKSDGTDAGTVLVKDITPATLDPFPVNLTASGGRLYFVADDSIHGSELWTSDGTQAGTVMVKEISPDPWSGPSELTDVDGTLFFFATLGYPVTGLWKTDGTESGTILVKNLSPPPGLFSYGARSLTPFGGHAVFVNDDGVHGLELWTSDGTSGGTVLLRDFDPGIQPAFPLSRIPRPELTDLDGTLWFAADDGSHGFELGKSDGTLAGTRLVGDLNAFTQTGGSFPRLGVEMNGTFFFSAFDPIHHGELWRTDGTSGGTVLVRDIDPGPLSSQLGTLVPLGSTLCFSATDETHGRELWKSDGTEAGTVLVKDINTQSEEGGYPLSSEPSTPFAWNGRVFFAADDGLHGRELWTSDGTGSGTKLVKDINPDTIPAGAFGSFSSIGGTLVFVADDGVHGFEIWRTDGTEEGTVLVKDIYPGPTQSLGGPAFDRAEVGGSILFRASDPAHGQELWKTDGTEAGTVLVKDFCPGTCAGFNSLLTNRPVIAGSLYFTRGAAVAGGPSSAELWKTDGTDEGTVLVKAFQPGTFFSILQLTDAGGKLFFLADDGIHGIEPWTSDGTEEGTVLVKDIRPGEANSSDTGNRTLWVTLSGIVYFTADDGVHGIELWRSDGTEEGTVLVKDIAPGPAGSLPTQITVIDGAVLFKADDGVHGVEPWRSDGTEEGTVLVRDVASGTPGSGTYFFTTEPIVAGNHVLMSLDDGAHGMELWSGRAAVVTGQPVRAIQDLRGELDGLHLPGGLGRVLGRELDEAALAAADPTRSQVAIAALERFRRKVEALSRHMISDEERASLLEFARDIMELLGGAARSTRHSGWEVSR